MNYIECYLKFWYEAHYLDHLHLCCVCVCIYIYIYIRLLVFVRLQLYHIIQGQWEFNLYIYIYIYMIDLFDNVVETIDLTIMLIFSHVCWNHTVIHSHKCVPTFLKPLHYFRVRELLLGLFWNNGIISIITQNSIYFFYYWILAVTI